LRADERVPGPSPRAAATIGIVLMAILMLVDLATWIELNIAVAYSIPLVFAAASRKPRLLWSMTAALIAITFIVYHIQISSARAVPVEGYAGFLRAANPYFIDRCLAALTILLTAAILQGWLISLRAIELRDLAIEQNNLRLEEINLELRRQQAEIAQQNAELDRRRREAEEISSRKTQMLASISHDIRTPIQSISLVAEAMRRTAADPSDARRTSMLAHRLQSHALSVAELLSEVIDLASFEQGKATVHESEFSLNELIDEQAQRLAPQAEARGLLLDVTRPLPCVSLRTDRAKLGRILANLVNNAIKFTSRGSITLTFQVDGARRVHIQVQDTGCGIRAENLSSIFGDFSQEDPAANRRDGGWGLGLAICQRLAGLLGGELQVVSEPGRGSTFEIVLPARATIINPPCEGGSEPVRAQGQLAARDARAAAAGFHHAAVLQPILDLSRCFPLVDRSGGEHQPLVGADLVAVAVRPLGREGVEQVQANIHGLSFLKTTSLRRRRTDHPGARRNLEAHPRSSRVRAHRASSPRRAAPCGC
jgi:signal transduction histidine kinase